jgi:hypothetical protein
VDWSFVGMAGAIPDGNPGDVTLVTPSGTQAGDVMVAVMGTNQDGQFSAAGWTRWSNGAVGFADGRWECFFRISDGTDPASTVFDFAGTTTRAIAMMAVFRPAYGVTVDPSYSNWLYHGSSASATATNPLNRSTTNIGATTPRLVVLLSMMSTNGTPSLNVDAGGSGVTHDDAVTDSDDEPLNARFDVGHKLQPTSPVPGLTTIFTRTGGTTMGHAGIARIAVPYSGEEIVPVTDVSAMPTPAARRVQVRELPHQVTSKMFGEPL